MIIPAIVGQTLAEVKRLEENGHRVRGIELGPATSRSITRAAGLGKEKSLSALFGLPVRTIWNHARGEFALVVVEVVE